MILNLKLRSGDNYLRDLKSIGEYEVQIADLEIEKGNFDKAAHNLLSAVKFFTILNDKSIFLIALRSIIDKNFNVNIKREFFKVLNRIKTIGQNLSRKSNRFLKFIITQYVENQYTLKKQNINKLPLYISSNLSFSENLLIDVPEISISTHPYYSSEIIQFLSSIEKCKIIKIQKNLVFPQENFKIFILNEAKKFRDDEKIQKSGFIDKINSLIEDFSQWKSIDIINWEKNLGLMDFFKTGEIIS